MGQFAVEEVAGSGFPGCSISRTKEDVELTNRGLAAGQELSVLAT